MKENGIIEEEVVNKIMLELMLKKVFISLEELGDIVDFLISSVVCNIMG